jgi:hypothetical protein
VNEKIGKNKLQIQQQEIYNLLKYIIKNVLFYSLPLTEIPRCSGPFVPPKGQVSGSNPLRGTIEFSSHLRLKKTMFENGSNAKPFLNVNYRVSSELK